MSNTHVTPCLVRAVRIAVLSMSLAAASVAAAAEPDAEQRRLELRKALLLAERLQSVLAGQQGISPQAVAHAESLVGELRERCAQQQRAGAA